MLQTQCSSEEARFRGAGGREVVARFDGGEITSDGGAVLLEQVDRHIGLLDRFAACFRDHRDPTRIEHSVRELIAQRVLALALGYEDLNDHDELRTDPLLAALVGKSDPEGKARPRSRDLGKPLAGSSTLNRLELGIPGQAATDRYKRLELDSEAVDRLLIEIFLDAYPTPPRQIVIDLDATDDPLHGGQEGRFFHGYYDCYCYLPLYIFCGDHLLSARLRESNIDPAKGSVEELERIVGQIREAWPQSGILIRGDSGFCRDWLMAWCEEREIDFVLGLARNSRLEAQLEPYLALMQTVVATVGTSQALFTSFLWSTLDSWSRRRRVIAKAECTGKGVNPRFIVTSLPCGDAEEAERIYREIYCARGEMENRIKEQQLDLFADRTSSHTIRANQIRLYFSSIAYTLIEALRRLGLHGTRMARAQCNTIRLKLLKVGALIRITVRRVWIQLASSCPYQDLFLEAWRRVRIT